MLYYCSLLIYLFNLILFLCLYFWSLTRLQQIALKITVKYIFVVFFNLFFHWCLSFEKLQVISFYSFESFSLQHQLKIFNWSLSDSKSPQVSRTLLSILANFNSVVVWMVSTYIFISNSSSLFTNPSVTVVCTPLTIDHCHFHIP